MSEIWNNAECCYWPMKYGTIEFANNIRAAVVMRNDNEGSKISRTHLAVKCFLDLCVADEDHVTTVEIEITDHMCVFLLEAHGGFASFGVNVRVKSIDVLGMLL